MSIHHLYPRSKGGTNESVNRLELADKRHINHHRYFHNETPLEQIKTILTLNKKCISNKFKKEIYNLLNGDEERYYENGVFRK